jgi:Cu/Ag efflux pump CusA
MQQVNNIIEVALGGKRLTTTVEGRERYPVRVRYERDVRDNLDKLGDVLITTPPARRYRSPKLPISSMSSARPRFVESTAGS